MNNQQENKICQNCKIQFTIEPEDFDFYKKIDVPSPTFCPECRIVRKMTRRNERALYKRICDLCKKETISMYNEHSPYSIYCIDCWWSDAWDPLSFGKGFDFSKSFFEQFKELSLRVPRATLLQKGDVGSPYTNFTDHNKNGYLLFNCGLLEDSLYSRWGISSKSIVDTFSVFDSELIYESQELKKCYHGVYLVLSESCVDSSFLFNCHGCQDCFLSSNLRNKKYCIRNTQYSKEEYEKMMLEIDLGSYAIFEITKKDFFENIISHSLRKYLIGNKLMDSTGDYLFECKNVKKSFHISESEDSTFCIDCANLKNCMDAYESAFNCELQYECHGCNRTSRSKFTSSSYDDFDLVYSEFSHNSNNLFGCIGLRNKQYCILNKQYTKEEYEMLIPKIMEHMNAMPYIDHKGRVYTYGEFFPSELSPFAYNETIAQEYFPLTKEEAMARGCRWRDIDVRDYKPTIFSGDLPDHIKDTSDSIANEVIQCAHKNCMHQCTTAFKIIPQELQFYRKMNLPLPRLCPNCRHYERLMQRNPMKLWHRKCMKEGCLNEFETSYSPDRKEVVYCEQCYQAEVV